MRNTSIPRTKVDCFTMDALEQIKATLNNQTPNFTNRGGVGKDVRELSDFALQQIKDAVGTNGGGGGGDVVQIKKMWSMTGTEENPTFTEIEKYFANNKTYYSIDADEVDVAIATDDDNTPNIQTLTNVAMIVITATQSVSYLKNIGLHNQQYSVNDARSVVRLSAESIEEAPFMEITIMEGGR